jgi:uncharacterized protein (DUF952 family)
VTDVLLHMIDAAGWRAARAAGAIVPAPGAGFVHLSTPAQVAVPANALFRGRDDVLLLVLDPGRLGVEVRFEPGDPPPPGDPSMLFPHAYGPIPTEAVRAVVAYRPGADGTFGPPADLPGPADPEA